MYLLVAISIGFLGIAHCAGMCGPLLLVVNQGNSTYKNDIIHHSGRILTYMIFGAIAGGLGSTFSVIGWQQGFSIAIGALMILSVLFMFLGKQFHKIENAISRVALKFSSWIHTAGFSRNKMRFLAGVGNGILPCGLVYLAIAGAANTFTPWDGSLFMLAFGLGTMPTLILISRFGKRLTPQFRSRIRKIIPITVFAMGALLIVRGANLGIPYVSPQASFEAGVAKCD